MRQRCPDNERLGDYIESRLSEEDRSDLENHLSTCEMCLEELVITNNIVARKDPFKLELPPPEVTDASVKLLTGRKLLPTSILLDYANKFFRKLGSYIVNSNWVWPWGRWNSTPVRGYKVAVNEDYSCLEVSFNNLKTTIEIEKIGMNKANIRLRLIKAIKNPKSIRITLKNGDREVASHLLDSNYVLFEEIPFGYYRISLAENNETIGTYSFEIKEGC